MLRIALCDDVPADLARLREMLEAWLALRPEQEAAVETYLSPFALLSELERGRFQDVYVLDILMPQMSGMELGRRIRERNRTCAIIFGTVTPEYALEAYSLQALHYLVKPFDRQALFDALDRALQQRRQEQAAGLLLRTPRGQTFLPYHRISYVELVERRMVFHLRDGGLQESLKLRGAFEAALAGLLGEPRFLQPHKSFVVNMDCVALWTEQALTLDDGAVIPVSARRLSAVQGRRLDYRARLCAGRDQSSPPSGSGVAGSRH